jgi:hypothetical protein
MLTMMVMVLLIYLFHWMVFICHVLGAKSLTKACLVSVVVNGLETPMAMVSFLKMRKVQTLLRAL